MDEYPYIFLLRVRVAFGERGTVRNVLGERYCTWNAIIDPERMCERFLDGLSESDKSASLTSRDVP